MTLDGNLVQIPNATVLIAVDANVNVYVVERALVGFQGRGFADEEA
jgi:hypothetical protein